MHILELKFGDVIENKNQKKFIFWRKDNLSGLTPGWNLAFIPYDALNALESISWKIDWCYYPQIKKSSYNEAVEVIEEYKFTSENLETLRKFWPNGGSEYFGLTSEASKNWIRTRGNHFYYHASLERCWKNKPLFRGPNGKENFALVSGFGYPINRIPFAYPKIKNAHEFKRSRINLRKNFLTSGL